MQILLQILQVVILDFYNRVVIIENYIVDNYKELSYSKIINLAKETIVNYYFTFIDIAQAILKIKLYIRYQKFKQ